jgi:cell division protein FtsZ
LGKNTSLLNAFKEANDVLFGAVQGIADLIIRPGMINVDFSDVRTVMSEMGAAMMGTGTAVGDSRAREAAEKAINSPLLDDIDLQGARGILVNITAGLDLSLGEFAEVGDTIEEFASEDATVVVGTVIDPEMDEDLKVTVVATGLSDETVKIPLQVVSERVLPDDNRPDYGGYDLPADRRQSLIKNREKNSSDADSKNQVGEEYFDIPAFLRKQAD